MKAERRHELKQNTLDKVLTGAPDVTRKYGGMVLLIALAAAAGFLLIRYRITSTREAHRTATENLATARTNINQLVQLDLYPFPANSKADLRKRWTDDARLAIDSITGSVSDPKLLAEALLARADLNWALAQSDELPGAATQPSLRLDTDRKTLLAEAESAYKEVVAQHADQKSAAVAANFGLAAVHESRGNWDQAKQIYQAIADDTSVAEAFRGQAKYRLDHAAEWSQPVLLATAATQPAAQSSIPFLNALQASTQPAATAAAAAATRGATSGPTTSAVER